MGIRSERILEIFWATARKKISSEVFTWEGDVEFCILEPRPAITEYPVISIDLAIINSIFAFTYSSHSPAVRFNGFISAQTTP